MDPAISGKGQWDRTLKDFQYLIKPVKNSLRKLPASRLGPVGARRGTRFI
jgi:hypothetical protein